MPSRWSSGALIMAEWQVATFRGQVTLSLFTDVENVSSFQPPGHHDQA
jgi:hypothetical protein